VTAPATRDAARPLRAGRAAARRAAARPALSGRAAPPQQLDGGEQEHGQQDQDRRGGEDGRAQIVLEPVEHLPGQGPLRRPGHEQGHDHLVERGHEGEQRASDNARRDQRQHHPAEHGDRWRTEAHRRARQRAVEAGERGRDRDQHERRAERGVHQRQPPQAVDQPERGQEEVGAGGDDHQRHDHRRDQQPGQQRLAAELGAGEADRRQGAEHGCDHGRDRADDQAVDERVAPRHRTEQLLIPAQRQPGHREAEQRAGVERQWHDHEGWQDQEAENQQRYRPQRQPADALGNGEAGAHQPSRSRSMPTSRA
jgi:hypothetical protein